MRASCSSWSPCPSLRHGALGSRAALVALQFSAWLFAGHVANPLHADLVTREGDHKSPKKCAGSSLGWCDPARFPGTCPCRPVNTMLHVPQSRRLRMIAVVARCWNGLATGLDEYALAGRSNLLLVSVPAETAAADEVSKRVEFCERSEFEALLHRCEQQKLLNQKNRERKRQPQRVDPAGKGDRGAAGKPLQAWCRP